MPPCLRAAAVAAAAAALATAACGSPAPAGGSASGSTSSSSTAPGAGAAPTAETGPGTADQTTGDQSPEPTAAPVADPCALLPKAALLAQLHADPATSHVDAASQPVPGGQGCDFEVGGPVDAEVLLSLEPASSVDTSDGGFSVAGHAAAYRQTEGGAADVDVTLGSTSAISVAVTLRDTTVAPDAARPAAQALAAIVVAAYHPS